MKNLSLFLVVTSITLLFACIKTAAQTPDSANRHYEYSIFFDEETNILFGVLNINEPKVLDELLTNLIMQKWWHYMADLMETNEDNSPVSIPLKEVFYMR